MSFAGLFTNQSSAPTPANPIPPITPASPASQTGTFSGLFADQNATPANTLPNTPTPVGGGYGASTKVDTASGRPLLTVPVTIPRSSFAPETTISQLDTTRTAPEFDPTVAQPVTSDIIHNPRMAESISQSLRKSLGATAFQELDHIMPLELGGSNMQSNLRLENANNSTITYNPSSNPTPTDPIENALGAQVKSGKISLVDAWRKMAQAKGITLQEDSAKNSPINQFMLDNPDVLTPLANLQENPGKTLGGWATDLWNGVKAVVSNPEATIAGAGTAIENFGLGVAKTLVKMVSSNPLANPLGISAPNNSLKEQGQKVVDFLQNQGDALNQVVQNNLPQNTDNKTAYAVGNFVGQFIPYMLGGGVAEKVGMDVASTALGASDLAMSKLSLQTISRLGWLTQKVSGLAGFLSVGQIEHNPDQGTRVDQLKNDLLNYAIFETGLSALKLTGKGAQAVLDVIDRMKSGGTVTLPEAENSVNIADAEIKKETGQTPQSILGNIIKTGDGIPKDELKTSSEIPTENQKATASPVKPSENEITQKTETPTETTPTENKIEQPTTIEPTTVKVSRAQLPVGEGETKTSGLAARMKATLDSVSEEEKGNIPDYKQLNNKDELGWAAKYVSENPDKAMEILKGNEPTPKGHLTNSLFIALKEAGKGDPELALKLASLRSTRFGQEIQILSKAEPYTPDNYIRQVQDSRIEALGREKVKGMIDKEVQGASDSVKRATADRLSGKIKVDWNSFIDSIEC